MQDRYLFRAKRIDNGEWVEGYYTYYPCGFTSVDKVEHAIRDTVSEYCSKLYFVDSSTICQCTGLKDRNGKLIWENDILMCHENPNDIVKVAFGEFPVINAETVSAVDMVVGWHYDVIPTDAISKCEPFCLSMPITKEYIKRCEMKVSGNIFDNPDLLEQEG